MSTESVALGRLLILPYPSSVEPYFRCEESLNGSRVFSVSNLFSPYRYERELKL